MRIAVLTVPATGHVNPTLDLVAELVRRGHDVTYLVPDEFAWAARLTGACHQPYESSLVAAPNSTPPGPDFALWLPFVLVAEARQVLPQLVAKLQGSAPDVLIYDRTTYLLGRMLPRLLDCRAVQFFPSFAYNRSFSLAGDRERATILNPDHEAHRQLTTEFIALARSWGDSPVSVEDFALARCDSAIVAIPRAFQPRAETFPDSYAFVGPGLHVRQARSTSGRAGPAEIYASLGTAFSNRAATFHAIARAIEDGGRTGLLAVGRSTDPNDLPDPSDRLSVERWTDQLAALAGAQVFITHAGMGSVQESIAFGVPMVCLPQTTEQQAVARRVVELKLGTALDGPVTQAQLIAAIDRVSTDPQIQRQVKRWAAPDGTTNAGTAAADVVEGI